MYTSCVLSTYNVPTWLLDYAVYNKNMCGPTIEPSKKLDSVEVSQIFMAYKQPDRDYENLFRSIIFGPYEKKGNQGYNCCP